jgi:ParB-like chromosome segregation protein Spo0J
MCRMTHTQRYELVDPALIEPNPWNTNVVSHENEVKLRASIQRNGMFKPVLVRELDDGTLQSLGGWHRAEQAVELGLKQIPAVILSGVSDESAKEISLADNARYGIDDTLKLSELLGELDVTAVEEIMPWTHNDIVALTASLAIDVDDLELDQPTMPTDDQDSDPLPSKPAKTHQVMRFRVAIADAAAIGARIQATQVQEGFNTADDLTNAGDALAFLLLDGGSTDDEDENDDAAA